MGHDEIRDFMQEKPTDELLAIWKENDRDRYSNAAFIAIESILRERGQVIEDQVEATTDQNERPCAVRSKSKTCFGRFVFFLSWLGVSLFHGLYTHAAILAGDLYIWIVVVLELIVLCWVAIKRLNDLNLSPWYVLLLFVPLANLLMIVVLLLFSGAPVEYEEDEVLQEVSESNGAG